MGRGAAMRFGAGATSPRMKDASASRPPSSSSAMSTAPVPFAVGERLEEAADFPTFFFGGGALRMPSSVAAERARARWWASGGVPWKATTSSPESPFAKL